MSLPLTPHLESDAWQACVLLGTHTNGCYPGGRAILARLTTVPLFFRYLQPDSAGGLLTVP